MATKKEAWQELEPNTRMSLISGRISNIENQLYNIHLNEVEGIPENPDNKTRLTNALAAMADERTAIQEEINALNPPPPPNLGA